MHVLGKSARSGLFFIVAMLATSLACTTILGDGGRAGSVDPTVPGSAAEHALECELHSYPCSYAEAEPAALQRGAEVLAIAEDIYLQQESMLAAGEHLRSLDDVVEVAYDSEGLWFRVQGAPPMWLWDFEASETGPDPTEAAGASSGSPLAAPVRQADGPVGPQPPGQEPEKRAVLIEPWTWQMGDRSSSVRTVLKEHRNYECANCTEQRAWAQSPPDPEQQQGTFGPPLDWFRDWSQFDIVYVYSHGRQWCGVPDPEHGAYFLEGEARAIGDCSGVLTTGSMRPTIFDNPNALDDRGVVWGHKPGDPWWYQGLTSDFFAGSNYDDMILFLNSCQLLANDSYPNALAGENTAVIGWNEVVTRGRGENTAVAFFEALIERGHRADTAFDKALESAAYTENSGAQLRLEGDHEPRGVEIVTWMHPAFDQPLQEVGSLPVVGIPDDGQNDELLLRLQVTGVREDQSPADFPIHIKVGDRELDRTLVASEVVAESTYEITEEVDLGFDVKGDEQRTLEAWIELPEGGESRHFVKEARLASCGWTGLMSGSRTGAIQGDIALDLRHFGEVDPELLAELELLGLIESADQLQLPADLSEAPPTIMLTGEQSVPALVANDQGFAMLLLGTNDVGFPQSNTNQLQFSTYTDEHIAGSIQAALLDAQNRANLNVQADFIWNAGSLCDIEVILESATRNPDITPPQDDGS